MNEVESHYRSKYRLPDCEKCDQDMLCFNSYRVHSVELFCANDECPGFVKTFWVDKTDLEEIE